MGYLFLTIVSLFFLLLLQFPIYFLYNFIKTDDKIIYGIIGAMESEVETLVSDLENKKVETKYGLTFYLGKLKKYKVAIVKCGVGKVNAGRTTQILISEYSPKYIINTGIAGGVHEDLKVGDIVISTDLIQYDFDLTALGFPKGYMYTGVDTDKPTKYLANTELSEEIRKVLDKVKEERKVFMGRILTGDTFISGKEKREELFNEFNGYCCEMEGAAIGQIASANEIPFTVLRIISDLPGGKGPEDYKLFEKESAKMSSLALETFLNE